MSIEKYISGKKDDGKHDGRASNIRREQEADFVLREDILFDLKISQQMVKIFSPDSEIYKFHQGRLDYYTKSHPSAQE